MGIRPRGPRPGTPVTLVRQQRPPHRGQGGHDTALRKQHDQVMPDGGNRLTADQKHRYGTECDVWGREDSE
jgi:hypothetical protein